MQGRPSSVLPSTSSLRRRMFLLFGFVLLLLSAPGFTVRADDGGGDDGGESSQSPGPTPVPEPLPPSHPCHFYCHQMSALCEEEFPEGQDSCLEACREYRLVESSVYTEENTVNCRMVWLLDLAYGAVDSVEACPAAGDTSTVCVDPPLPTPADYSDWPPPPLPELDPHIRCDVPEYNCASDILHYPMIFLNAVTSCEDQEAIMNRVPGARAACCQAAAMVTSDPCTVSYIVGEFADWEEDTSQLVSYLAGLCNAFPPMGCFASCGNGIKDGGEAGIDCIAPDFHENPPVGYPYPEGHTWSGWSPDDCPVCAPEQMFSCIHNIDECIMRYTPIICPGHFLCPPDETTEPPTTDPPTDAPTEPPEPSRDPAYLPDLQGSHKGESNGILTESEARAIGGLAAALGVLLVAGLAWFIFVASRRPDLQKEFDDGILESSAEYSTFSRVTSSLGSPPPSTRQTALGSPSMSTRPLALSSTAPASDDSTAPRHEADKAPPTALPSPSAPSPLPEGWTIHTTDDGTVYYFNATTGDSRWDRPT